MTDAVRKFKQRVRRYLHTRDIYINDAEIQVTRTTSSVHGKDWIATIESEGNVWWLIGGATPITMNKKEEFENIQEVYYFHVGITNRLIERQNVENAETLDSEIRHAFINHASEDKPEFVEPLFDKLREKGLHIWYDDNELRAGESIRRSIEDGLQINAYGISVLSEIYFEKNWAQEELDILVDQQTTAGKTIIIPIWYDISAEDVRRHNSTLANRYAVTGDEKCISEIADTVFNDIVEDAKQEGRSHIPLDEDILRSNNNDQGNEPEKLLVTDIMRSHDVHYFDSRYFDHNNVDPAQASDIVDSLNEADDVLHIASDHKSGLAGLSDGDYVIVEAPIARTPLNQFNYLLQSYRNVLDIDGEFDGQEGQMILSQIEDAAEYFRAKMPPNRDGNFVFKLSQNSTFQNISEYVDDHRNHFIFGTVKHVYEQNEKDHFLDILDDVPGKSRKERTEQRIRLKEMASELDDISNETVSESDFYIAYPDITLTPIAVYD